MFVKCEFERGQSVQERLENKCVFPTWRRWRIEWGELACDGWGDLREICFLLESAHLNLDLLYGGDMSVSSSATPKPSFFSGIGCWASLAIIVTSMFLYLMACIAPAMVFDKETWPGYQVLLAGVLGVFLGQFAWFANIFWGLSLLLVFFRRWFMTVAATGLTILIALDALAFSGARVPLDEANVNAMVFQSYHVGFYFWLASLLAVGVGAIVAWVVTRFVKR